MTITTAKKTSRRPGWNKYGAKVTYVDGIKFHSGSEAKRWVQLNQWERLGVIRKLKRQVKYRLDVNGVHIGNYTADFVYEQKEVGSYGFPLLGEVWTEVVEDVKGAASRDFVLRCKLMLACHGVTVKVYKARG